ncbi:CRISPR-associated ring nuclease Csm6 [Vibrio parahaemolyticus]|uniref:CRISPR-associated ring nuclease Csm6 n=1 Tax=Vibrio parahaemolyticus TaxID=670 RepID=UPI001121D89E|nr:CRISPR-associated ring nuclease Csm6 [Vibrio parahaemolyticus]EHZ2645095.1 TIGR02584 family CRISPR-associated protein [Vibrio parahaemolyticus]ELM4064158.1 TIGR02584 family CRISPR-associated protein [Vibrio parahaemolyticus]TOI40350.1 CRISPR-associated protein [Vibrio parahaemolyticus]
MKNILIAVTGASPQVLTETIYALYKQRRNMPEEVFVITTANSKKTLEKGLFEDGHWQQLVEDYQLPEIHFDSENICLIEDDHGNVLSDAKTESDQSVMADFITRKVAELTADDNLAIHASIAGGRKTMAFYMGYAMSLYGREQDVLSHVFVDDDFEFVSDFYYPTPYDKYIVGRDKNKVINTKDAQVTLAEIPFVRMRRQVDAAMFTQMHQHSFSKTVSAMNSASSNELCVSINSTSKTLKVAGISLKLTGKELAIYLFFLTRSERKLTLDRYFEEDVVHTRDYLNVLDIINADVRLYRSMGLEDEGQWRHGNAELIPMTKDFVRQSLNAFHKAIERSLVIEVVEKIKVHSDGAKSGASYSICPSLNVVLDGNLL